MTGIYSKKNGWLASKLSNKMNSTLLEKFSQMSLKQIRFNR